MKPLWVNVVDRKPNQGCEVQVLVVHDSARGLTGGDIYDVEYGFAKYSSGGRWIFIDEPQYTWIVAWLESERRLDRSELENVPKDSVRF